ncbi:MAG: flavodoxin domain-containing protein [Bacteroidales bacterium]|jgi:menaquinone-dependent protoporphyrinogen IX oxidase|nr:flavodoxin domain-containing protein [Bacteroidales bacterium]
MKILITCAGITGPAASAADRIARVMTGLGDDVVVKPMSAVSAVKGFSAVIAGCLEQNGEWVPEAMEFVRRNQGLLNRKPFAIFTIVPLLDTKKGAESRMVVMQYTAHVRGMVHTVSEGFFSGETVKKDKSQPGERSKFKLMILLSLLKEGDHRIHSEIEVWAAKLHEKLIRDASPAAKSPAHGS